MRSQKAMVVLSFLRNNPRCSVADVAAVFNFSDQCQADYTLEIPQAQGLTLLLDSDSAPFGGSTQQPVDYLPVTEGQVTLTLPPFSGRLYQIQ